VSVSFVSAVERGLIYPSLKSLEKLAARLQVSVSELFTRDNGIVWSGDHGLAQNGVTSGGATVEPIWESFETEVCKAQVLILQGEAKAAVELLLIARSRAVLVQQQALVDWCLASAYIALGRWDLAQQTATGALVVAVRSGPLELVARLRIALAQAAAQAGNHALARDRLLEVIAGILPADQPRPSADGWHADPMDAAALHAAVAAEYEQLGDMERAIEHLREAARRVTETAHSEQRGTTDWLLSQQQASRGNLRWARVYVRRSLAAFEAADIERRATATQVLLGRALARVGQYELGLTELYQAREVADLRRNMECLAEIMSALALTYLEARQVDEAAWAAMESVRYTPRIGIPGLRMRSLLALARVQEAQGELDAANASYRQAIEAAGIVDEDRHESTSKASGSDSPRDRPRRAHAEELREVYVAYAELLERRGETAQALAMLKQAIEQEEQGRKN
jgi:tetratricopeptide (TPR) repeat protein